jgi:hypothetical protein
MSQSSKKPTMGIKHTMGLRRTMGLLRPRSEGMGELTRGERLQIMLSPEELRAINTWRFAKRMPSRASAIRELLKRGLAAEGFLEAAESQKSKDFSVLKD